MELQVTSSVSPELVKVALACKINGLDLKIGKKNIRNGDDGFELQLPSGNILFSSNASVRYVFELISKIEMPLASLQWLEWEVVNLRPIVAELASNDNSKLRKCLHSSLAKLETAWKTDSLKNDGAVQCVIACALYPVLSENPESSAENWSGMYPCLYSWFSTYVESSNFKQTLKDIVGNKMDPSGYISSICKKAAQSGSDSIAKHNTKSGESAEITEKISKKELDTARTGWSSAHNILEYSRQHPILPQPGKKNILITSALPYVNNIPHLGNIIGCVLSADVFSRYCRLQNWNCLYICGTDEYGTATETRAVQEGLTPQQICDKYNKLHAEVYEWFNIDFDYFGRTTTQHQTEIAQDIFWHLHRNNYLLPQTVEQLYCRKCDRFLADRFVEGTCPLCNYEDARGDQCDECGKLINATELKNPKCKICSSTPEIKTSNHLFVDLPKLEPKLREFLKKSFTNPGWSSNAKTITESWLRDGIKPRCITRDLKWGTPVPLEGYTDKVFYVWFDAPIGYISITANYTDQWEKWWKNPEQVEMYNFMAKDNVPFHSVVFPATLLGTSDSYSLVSHLNAAEYLNYEDGKFSKSRGVGVFGNHAKETGIDSDIWRFYLLYVRPENQDTVFSWSDLMLKNNSELLNNLGNFINRSLKFADGSFGGVLPKALLTERDLQLVAFVNREVNEYICDMTKVKLRDNLRKILNITRLGNQYFQENQPWKLIKGSDAEKERAGTVTTVGVNLSCLVSILLEPFLPTTSRIIWEQMNAPKTVISKLPECFQQLLPGGHKINKPSPLFRKLEENEILNLKEMFAGDQDQGDKVKQTSKNSVAQDRDAFELEAQVAKQGEIVRDLKSKKAEKLVIDKEVAELLRLKKLLAMSKGEDPNASKKGKKQKK